MRSEQMRAEFERWCLSESGTRDALIRKVDGTYLHFQLKLAFEAWQAAYAAGQRTAVPEGYVLVPVEPTEAMLAPFNELASELTFCEAHEVEGDTFKDAYATMLTAAQQEKSDG